MLFSPQLIRPNPKRVVAASGVSFDAISNPTPVAGLGGTTLSWTHTPVGTPTAVAVMVGGYQNGVTISGVTYGGVSMSAGSLFDFGNSTNFSQMFGLANPSSGPQTVVITFSAGGIFAAAAALTVTGSDTATCFSNSSGMTNPSSSSVSDTVTSAAGELVVDCVTGYSAAAAASGVGGAQTSRYSDFWNGISFGVSTAPGAASVTTTWSTVSSSDHVSGAIASFKAP